MAERSLKVETLNGVVNLFFAAVVAYALVDGGRNGQLFGLTILVLNMRSIARSLYAINDRPTEEHSELRLIRQALERIQERFPASARI